MKKILIPTLLVIGAIGAIFVYSYSGVFFLQNIRLAGTGTIEATEYSLGSPLGGIVDSIRVKEGDIVKAGDLIGVIRHRDLLAEKKALESGLAAAEADIAQAEVKLASAKRGLERLHGVARSGSVSEQKVDDAETANKQVASLLEASKKQRERLQFQMEALSEKIAYATVTAPASGMIVERYFESGELVPSGGTLVKLADLSEVWLKIYIPEQDLGRVKVGQKASVTIDSFPGRVFEGRVTWISSVAEFTPKNVQTEEARVRMVFGVKVAIPNPEGIFKIGLPATIKLEHQT